jgi:hypothetical protein
VAHLRRSRSAAHALGRRRPLTAPAAAGALVRTLNERLGSDLSDLWTDEDTVEFSIDGARNVEVLTLLRDDPEARQKPAEEVSRELVRGGYLQEEPDPVLVAEMLEGLEAEEQSLQADELTEEGNPT